MLLCLQGKLHTLRMLAVALGHRGVKGGGWRRQPGELCLLLPDKQKLCSWYYELAASPRVT